MLLQFFLLVLLTIPLQAHSRCSSGWYYGGYYSQSNRCYGCPRGYKCYRSGFNRGGKYACNYGEYQPYTHKS